MEGKRGGFRAVNRADLKRIRARFLLRKERHNYWIPA
jgi:hypothetical protein